MKQRIMSVILTCILLTFASCKTNINGEVAKKRYAIRFTAVGVGNITATVNGKEINSAQNVEEGAIIEFKASVKDEEKHEIDRWVGAEENIFDKTRARLIVSKEVEVKVVFRDKEPIKVSINFNPGPNGRIKAGIDNRELQSGDRIVKDSTVYFEAIPDDGYKVSSWMGAIPNEADNAHATAIAKTDLNVYVLFTPLSPQDVVITEVKIKGQKANLWLKSIVLESSDRITKDDVEVMGRIAGESVVDLEVEKIDPKTYEPTIYGKRIKITTKETQRYKTATISIFVVKRIPDKKYIQVTAVSVKEKNVDPETHTVIMDDNDLITSDNIKLTILKDDGTSEVITPSSISPNSVTPNNKANNGKGAECVITYSYDHLSYKVNIFIKYLDVTV